MNGPKICFAASSGGHFEQVMMMRPLFGKYDSFIVTERTKFGLDPKGMKMYLLSQVNRKEWKFPILLIWNFLLSIRIILKENPDMIVSTGALSTIPLCVVMKLMGKRVLFMESFANVSAGTKTGKLLYKLADKFYIQWKGLERVYPKGVFVGGIY